MNTDYNKEWSELQDFPFKDFGDIFHWNILASSLFSGAEAAIKEGITEQLLVY